MRTQIKNLGISEKKRKLSWTFLLISSKRNIFLHFKTKKKFWNIDLQTILHPAMNYWFQHGDLHQTLAKFQRLAEECTKNLGDTFHCRHTYIR